MNDEKHSELFSFESKIKDDGSIDVPEEKFLLLKQKGFSEIKIVVYADSKKAAANLGYDSNLFDSIKNMQTLPDAVVLEFLSSKGKLKGRNFENRILF